MDEESECETGNSRLSTRPGGPLYRHSPAFSWVESSGNPDRRKTWCYLIRWESVEAHEVNFRQTPKRQQFRDLIGKYWAEPPCAEHFEPITNDRIQGVTSEQCE